MFHWLLGSALLIVGGVLAIGLLFLWLIMSGASDDDLGDWE